MFTFKIIQTFPPDGLSDTNPHNSSFAIDSTEGMKLRSQCSGHSCFSRSSTVYPWRSIQQGGLGAHAALRNHQPEANISKARSRDHDKRSQGGKIGSTRRELDAWIKTLPQPRTIAGLASHRQTGRRLSSSEILSFCSARRRLSTAAVSSDPIRVDTQVVIDGWTVGRSSDRDKTLWYASDAERIRKRRG
jgi:hypothetical protein